MNLEYRRLTAILQHIEDSKQKAFYLIRQKDFKGAMKTIFNLRDYLNEKFPLHVTKTKDVGHSFGDET